MPTTWRDKVANGEEHNGVEVKGAEKAWCVEAGLSRETS
jgi:hypothetical protein